MRDVFLFKRSRQGLRILPSFCSIILSKMLLELQSSLRSSRKKGTEQGKKAPSSEVSSLEVVLEAPLTDFCHP